MFTFKFLWPVFIFSMAHEFTSDDRLPSGDPPPKRAQHLSCRSYTAVRYTKRTHGCSSLRPGALLEQRIVHIFQLRRWIRKVKHTPEVLPTSALESLEFQSRWINWIQFLCQRVDTIAIFEIQLDFPDIYPSQMVAISSKS